MKNSKNNFYKCAIVLCVSAIFSSAAFAQTTYFAGSGSGTGNTGSSCTGVGIQTLHSNNQSSSCSAFGYKSLYANSTGSYNTGHGSLTLFSNTSGDFNTAIGGSCLATNSTGSANTATGFQALGTNTTASNNNANGYNSLLFNTTGHDNTASGYSSLRGNSSASYNSAYGSKSLYSNTTGHDNTATGYNSMYTNKTGDCNTANGSSALYSAKAFHNTATGFKAMYTDTSGAYNTANGSKALYNNINGSYNNAMGFVAMYNNSIGYENSAMGDSSLYRNDSGFRNVAIGGKSLFNNVAGNENTAIGKNAGALRNAYTNCTFVGSNADASVTGFTNATALGYQATVDAGDKVRIGNADVTSITGQVNFTASSDARIKDNVQENVAGLAFIKALRPVTFHYNLEKQNALLGVKEKITGSHNIEKIAFSGFLAQEVDEAAKKTGYDFSGVDKSGNILGLRYAEFVVPIVKSVQELDAENTQLKTENEKQNEKINLLENKIKELQQCMESLCNASSLKTEADNTGAAATFLKVNPNPTTGKISISFQLEKSLHDAVIKIIDEKGTVLKSVSLNDMRSGMLEMDLGNLPNGTYIVQLAERNRMLQIQKFVLSK